MGRVLRRPSWIAFTVLVLVLAVTFVELGRWQWRRHDERAAFNDRVRASLAAPAVPVDELLAPGAPVAPSQEWREVTATGRYDVEHQLLVRNRVLEGELGFEVITPLVTAAGTALLVDRGWVPVGETAADQPAVPEPPAGDVTVTAHVQTAETGGSGADGLPAGQLRRVDVADLSAELPYPVYGAYAALLPGQPGTGADEAGPRALQPPELGGGPHLAYAIQWWLFTGIAVGGWVILLRAEGRPGDARTPGAPRARGRYLDTGPRPDDEEDWDDEMTTHAPATASAEPAGAGGTPIDHPTARGPGVRA